MIQLAGPGVAATDGVMRLIGYRRVSGKKGDADGTFVRAWPCQHCRPKLVGRHVDERAPATSSPPTSWWRRLVGWIRG